MTEKLTLSEIDKIKEELSAFVENNDDFFSTCELGTTEEEVNTGAIRFWQRQGFIQANDFEYRCGTSRKRAEFEKKVKESENDSRFSEYTKTED
ncbi:MAG: hypothetical protein RBT87_10875 [bacterium]|nr:hypothetical protein [bacterium]